MPSGQGAETAVSNSRSVVTTHERIQRMIRWNSGVDGTVRKKEGLASGNFCMGSHLPRKEYVFGIFIWMDATNRKIYPLKKQTVQLPAGQSKAEQLALRLRVWLTPISLLLVIAIWAWIARVADLPSFTLPTPAQVGNRLIQAVRDGTLLRHASFTLLEVLLGLFAGTLLATFCGYWIAKSRAFEKLIEPYLVASQAIPVVAIAPLLVIWFGPGMISKVLICSLTLFFPVLINTVVGLRAVPEDLRMLMRSLHATPAQTLKYLEIPAALPVFLGGLRVGATLSVIGAVVGELVGSNRGLGFLVNIGRGQYDTALVFVAVFTLVTMALALYLLVTLLERRLLYWQTAPSRQSTTFKKE